MLEVVVTGGTGVLGQSLLATLERRGIAAKGLSRRANPATLKTSHWIQGDLLMKDSLKSVFDGVDVVVHCASNPQKPADDLITTRNVLQVAKNVSHFVYVGIAGIEDAAKRLPYYQIKLNCEAEVAASGVPCTIVRAAQFHEFTETLLRRFQFGPFQVLPPMRLQTVELAYVAERVATHALAAPQQRAPDIHGPERLDGRELVRAWCKAHQTQKMLLPLPDIGMVGTMNHLRPVDADCGGKTWEAWLSEKSTKQEWKIGRR